MKIKKLTDLSKEPWTGDYEDLLKSMGFGIIEKFKGQRDNWTDGEYHKIFKAKNDNKIYEINITGNIYYNEVEKYGKILKQGKFKEIKTQEN